MVQLVAVAVVCADDADGNRASATYPDGTVISYTYTGRNQLATVSQNSSQICGYAYDAAGRPIAKALANGITTGYSYDDAGQLTTLNSQLSTISYSYNNVGNRTSMSRSDTRAETYSYDATDQLVAVNYGAYGTNAARSASYAYDPVGNRWMTTFDQTPTAYAANALNQYVQVGGQLLHYDANGNLISQPGWTYSYDAFNRLISAKSVSSVVTFAYDGRNRCVSRTLNPDPGAGAGGTTIYFYWDGWSLIEERDSSGAEVARYVHGARIDEVLIMARNGTNYFYHADALGSVTHLTDSTGTVVEKYIYDVFGAPTILALNSQPSTLSQFGNRFAFTGREWLGEVGLYDYRNRAYSPTMGRFLQTDPIGFEAGDVNLYRYVENAPPNALDPLGLQKRDCRLEIVAGHAGRGPRGETQATGLYEDCLRNRDWRNMPAGDEVGYVCCGADALNYARVPEKHRIPNMPKNDFRGYDLPADALPYPEGRSQLYRAIEVAMREAKRLCNDKNSCCKSVTIEVDCRHDFRRQASRWWSSDNPCDFKMTIPCP